MPILTIGLPIRNDSKCTRTPRSRFIDILHWWTCALCARFFKTPALFLSQPCLSQSFPSTERVIYMYLRPYSFIQYTYAIRMYVKVCWMNGAIAIRHRQHTIDQKKLYVWKMNPQLSQLPASSVMNIVNFHLAFCMWTVLTCKHTNQTSNRTNKKPHSRKFIIKLNYFVLVLLLLFDKFHKLWFFSNLQIGNWKSCTIVFVNVFRKILWRKCGMNRILQIFWIVSCFFLVLMHGANRNIRNEEISY